MDVNRTLDRVYPSDPRPRVIPNLGQLFPGFLTRSGPINLFPRYFTFLFRQVWMSLLWIGFWNGRCSPSCSGLRRYHWILMIVPFHSVVRTRTRISSRVGMDSTVIRKTRTARITWTYRRGWGCRTG